MVPRTRHLLVAASLAAAALVAGCVAPPESLACRADNEGNHLAWEPVENATHYNVYRGAEGSDFANATLVGTSLDTSFTDAEVEEGETYRYWVTAVGPLPEELPEEEMEGLVNESEPSEPCDVTAVPFFPGLVLGALAVAGCVGAYVVMRRRA